MLRSKSLFIALFLVGLLALFGLFSVYLKPVRGARVILAFLPPAANSAPARADESSAEQAQLKAWSHPVDWASDYLMSDQAPADLDQAIPKASPSVRSRAITLWEERRLRLKEMDALLLEIEVQESDRQIALTLCQGLVTSLKARIQKEVERLELNPQQNTPAVLALEKLEAREARLTSLSAQNPSAVAQQFALQHFQEDLRSWRRVKRQREQWRRQLQDCAPDFSIIAGPELIRKNPQSFAPLVLSLLLTGLLGAGLTHKGSPLDS